MVHIRTPVGRWIALGIFVVARVAGDEFLVSTNKLAFIVFLKSLSDESDCDLCEFIHNRLLSDSASVFSAVFQYASSPVFNILPLALQINGQVRGILVAKLNQEVMGGLVSLLLGHNIGIHASAVP